jgi:hypothetical protein
VALLFELVIGGATKDLVFYPVQGLIADIVPDSPRTLNSYYLAFQIVGAVNPVTARLHCTDHPKGCVTGSKTNTIPLIRCHMELYEGIDFPSGNKMSPLC